MNSSLYIDVEPFIQRLEKLKIDISVMVDRRCNEIFYITGLLNSIRNFNTYRGVQVESPAYWYW